MKDLAEGYGVAMLMALVASGFGGFLAALALDDNQAFLFAFGSIMATLCSLLVMLDAAARHLKPEVTEEATEAKKSVA